MCKLGRAIKKLFTKDIVKKALDEDTLCQAAEIYLLTQKGITPADTAIIRQAIVDIKSGGLDEAIRKQAKERLKEVLDKYKNYRGDLDPDPRD